MSRITISDPTVIMDIGPLIRHELNHNIKTDFLAISVTKILDHYKTMPQDDPVYQFLDKKRTQGKAYYVYMTAGVNKFFEPTMAG